MADQQGSDLKLLDPTVLGRTMTELADRGQAVVGALLANQAAHPGASMTDPLGLGSAFYEMSARLAADPLGLARANLDLWQNTMSLWQNATLQVLGAEVKPLVEPEKGDRRFKDEAWTEHTVFDFIKQAYLLSARWMQTVVHNVDGLDPHTAEKVDFFTRQMIDALAPSNFLLTNPEALRETLESGGENLVRGMENLLHDLERGKGQLRISMTDESAFTVGENVAGTPGKVVFKNALLELIQYTPTTETVHRRPLLIVPPWINKYYILDLRPKNSFVKWAVDQGHTVFMISWVNPDASLRDKGFEDYMLEGPLAALDAIREITGEPDANIIGYCLGGTLTGCLLAWLTRRGEAHRLASATHFTTMLDFTEPGELGVFIDEPTLQYLEGQMNKNGYLDGSEMAGTFNLLRSNDLIWSFVINNYLLGKDPFPFDLLYWNADNTRMPAAMHSFYLRKMYLENILREPGGITLAGEPIDLRLVQTPAYFVSCREDHIAPWRTTYFGTHLYQGPVRFVLAASGHIAGVVNPPVANKYGFWTNTALPPKPEAWLEAAERHDGSWWTDWNAWVQAYAGDPVAPRVPQGEVDAPGTYVTVRV
ncbi:PHA/PHB synthase family protein [Pararhodospirillum photometricum]|uniref:Poly(R)-hydroxyalkanoic acid synthase, class I n=1 Tax=Pararhodospirillum photometricum DSM 122 TaxID=1150469 RepID=H6SLB4_PARPM|nr:class I poly(R)-hydroxyalkanoic acid synthase [Pararhodospirillum photometricum]CCG08779.1 Poly(R)-hydroxyalkanoic acid synthase, class I [Pararhodospirillum photometricum DSM 122]